MQENNFYEEINYYIIITILIFFLIFCLTYFSFVIHYLKQNYYKNITALWIDYCITILIGIIYTILYLTTLLIKKTERIKNLEYFYSNKLIISSISTLLLFFNIIIINLFFDIIKSVDISYKTIKFIKIKIKDLPNLVAKLKEINIMNYFKPHKHYFFIIIANFINILLVCLFIIIYSNLNIQNHFFSIQNYNIYFIKYTQLATLFALIVCFLLILIIKKCLNNKKCYIGDKFIMNIYNIINNQIVYYIDILYLKICIDLFVNISLIFFITLSKLNTIHIIFFEICLFAFIFVEGNILLSIDDNKIIINNEHKNKIKKTKILKKIFCFKDFHLRFINNNSLYLFMNEYEYYYNLPQAEIRILSKLNINFIKGDYNLSEKNDNSNFKETNEVNVDVKEEKDKSSNDDDDDNDDDGDDNSELNTFSEYYILYKLLYIFFDTNKDSYSNLIKKIKKNGDNLLRQYSLETNSSGKKSNIRRNRKQKEGDNMSNIKKIIQISELESQNLILLLNLNKDKIFNTEKEKELLEELNQKYNNNKKKNEFIIESLSQKPLFEIFAFYQLKIEDILKSLKPSNNNKVFKLFLDNLNKSNNNNDSQKNMNIDNDKNNENVKNSNIKNENNESCKINQNTENDENDKTSNNKNEKNLNKINQNLENNEIKINSNNKSDKNLNKINQNSETNESKKLKYNICNNESDSENKSSESNNTCFHSYNYLLMMEIYNESDFIDLKQIIELTSSFKQFVIKNIKKKMNCTFLSLLIGIYNVKFLGKNKIIVLYRNPLYFTIFPPRLNYEINYKITDTVDKIKKNYVVKNEIIDINEIEIKDSIKLSYNDYEEIKSILKSDLLFLSKLSFQVYPVIHLFIGYNTAEELKNSESFIGSLGSQHSFSALLNSSSEGCISLNNSIKKKDLLNLEYNSLLEKEFNSINGNKDMFTIKIYMTNYFRLQKLNKEEGKIFLFNRESYYKYLINQVLSYIIKKNNFSSDSEISIKSSEDEVLIKKADFL